MNIHINVSWSTVAVKKTALVKKEMRLKMNVQKKKIQQELTSIVFVHLAGNTAEDHHCGCSVSTVYFDPIKVK